MTKFSIKNLLFFNLIISKLLISISLSSNIIRYRILRNSRLLSSNNNNLIKKDLFPNKNVSYSFAGAEKIISISDDFFASSDVDLNDSKSSWYWWENKRKSEHLLKNAIASNEVIIELFYDINYIILFIAGFISLF